MKAVVWRGDRELSIESVKEARIEALDAFKQFDERINGLLRLFLIHTSKASWMVALCVAVCWR